MAKILVVDDSKLILEAVKESLESDGHEVVLTDNPLEVPHLIRDQHSDLVLIDLNMPTMRGNVVARIVRKAFGREVVVLLHTEVPEEARLLLELAGAEGVVAKSADESVVRDAVRSSLKPRAARVG